VEGLGVTVGVAPPNEPRAPAEYFGERAVVYDSRYDRPDADGYALRRRMEAVLGLVGNGSGELLDAGMGPGRLCAELAGRGWTVTGVDASAEMVDVARARMPGARERLLCARIESLPFPDASFDVVTSNGVIDLIPNKDAVFAELYRVLRPGGRLQLADVTIQRPVSEEGRRNIVLWTG